MKSKIITINNYNDYNKFLKRINIYKSILYYNTLFEVKNNINERNIDYITNALNMKNRKKRIEYVYDQSCKLIDWKNKGINICGFENGKCWVQRKKMENVMVVVESVYIKQVMDAQLKIFRANYLIVQKLDQDIM